MARIKKRVKKILFTLIPEKGHINPYIPVALHLKERGHQVGFYSPRDISEQLMAAGLDGFTGEFVTEHADINRSRFFSEKVRDKAWLRQWIKSLVIDHATDLIEPLRKVIGSFRPDVIVADPMIYASAIAAELEGIPWAAVSNSLNPVLDDSVTSDLLATLQWLQPQRKALFEGYGLKIDCRCADMLSPHLTIAFTTPELTGGEVPGVEQVGPSIPSHLRGDETPFDWEKLDPDLPLVYFSLGSQIYYQPRMFKTVFEAVRGQRIQLVATVNELVHKNREVLGEVPENVILSYYTPQLQLLQRTSVMITHGGANSVMEAIYFGVPMLISPICNDQFHQVHYIGKQGIGLHLDLQQAAVAEIRQAIMELLSSPSIKKNMERVSKSYQVDGAPRAAELVEKLIK